MHIATKCCWESHHVAPFSRNSCTYCIPLQRNLGITGLHVATIVCTPVHRCAWPPLAVAKFVLQSTFSCDLHLQDRQISAVVVTCTINNPSIFCAVKLAHYNLVTVQVVGRWCHIGLAVLKKCALVLLVLCTGSISFFVFTTSSEIWKFSESSWKKKTLLK